MQTYNCPSCGAEIRFQSNISMTCVCAYCRSLIVRHDMNLETLGKVAELPDDMTPFQIGTKGIYKNLKFEIIGRLRMAWKDGYWNEWFLYIDDHKKAWLVEAQGHLAIVFEETISEQEAKTKFAKPPKLNEKIRIAGIDYIACDIKESRCIGSEGELPFAAPKGQRKTVDLMADDRFAGIEYIENQAPAIFTGKYVEFDDLSFSHLRQLDGWKLPTTKAKKIL